MVRMKEKRISAADTIYDVLVVLYIGVDTNDSPLSIKNNLDTKTKDNGGSVSVFAFK